MKKSPDRIHWRKQSEQQPPQFRGVNDYSYGATFSQYRHSLQVQSETKPKYISVPIILPQTARAEGTPASAAHNEKAHRKEGLKIWARETDMPQ